MRLVLYCDESIEKGRHFSNFYGGALVKERRRQALTVELNELKEELNLFGELKWTKISENYAEKYILFMEKYFDIIQRGEIKIRVMFTQNKFTARNLSADQLSNSYSLLYYQFIKHAFGLQFCGPSNGVSVAVFLDDFPDKYGVLQRFREYISSLGAYPPLRQATIRFPIEDVTDVRSHDHVIMQGLDIILGSIQFRLNDKHLEIPKGMHRRGKRTRAKEKVYKYINGRIRDIYPGFNIGKSTGINGDLSNRWKHPYRHWVFLPSDHEVDRSVVSKKAQKRPRD